MNVKSSNTEADQSAQSETADPSTYQTPLGSANDISQLQFTRLLEICHNALSSIDLQEVLVGLIKDTTDLLRADSVQIALIEKTASTNAKGLIPISRFAKAEEIQIESHTPLAQAFFAGKGLGGQAYQTGAMVVCSDYFNTAPQESFEHTPYLDQIAAQERVGAVLVVPLVVEKKVVGMMWIRKHQPYFWQPSDLLQSQHLASSAALAIYNAWLYYQLLTANEALNRRNQELEAFHELTQRLYTDALELEPTAQRALKLALDIAQAEAGAIHIINRHRPSDLKLVAHSGFESPLPGWVSNIELGQGLAGRVANIGHTLMVDDVQTLRKQQPTATLNPDPQWRSGLFVPLIITNKVIGVIGLSSTSSHHFTPQTRLFIETLAGHIAEVIGQSLQIEFVKDQERLKAALALANTVAHELNQPLAFIQAELELITNFGLPPQLQTFEQIQDAITSIANKVREYQRLSQVETTSPFPGIIILDEQSRAIGNDSTT